MDLTSEFFKIWYSVNLFGGEWKLNAGAGLQSVLVAWSRRIGQWAKSAVS